MKEQLQLLRDLQAIDLQLDELERSKAHISKQLADHKSMLDKLEADLEGQRQELTDTIALKAQREEELADAEERFAQSKERLMNVSSTKEYNAVEKEMDGLKKKAEETRERLDHLKEAIEVAERAITEKEEKVVEIRDQIREVEAEAEGRLAKLDGTVSKTKKQREGARKSVKPPVLRRYDFIRRRIPNTVVAAKNAHCEGCFMAIPPQLYIEIQRGNSLHQCPSCQRILYFYGDAEEAAADA